MRHWGAATAMLGALRNRLALGGVDNGAQHATMQDGTVISVIWTGSQNIVRITAPPEVPGGNPVVCVFYLESGVAEHTLAGVDHILEQQIPSVLHRAEDDTVPLSDGEETDGIIQWNDAILSLSQMPKDKADSIAFGIPGFGDSEADQEKINEGKESLFSKISCSTRFPSSLYSGKLQLLIQSLYGSDIADFTLGYATPDNTIPYLIWGNKEIHFEWGDTSGVWTDPDTFDYYLVRVKVDKFVVSATCASLDLGECGEKLRDFLIETRESDEWKDRLESDEWRLLQRKIEGYILSSASPNIDDFDIIIESSLIDGSPFSQHGWAFSWSGNTADVVTHDVVSLGGGDSKRIARHYQLILSRTDSADSPLAASISIVEQAEYQFRAGRDHVWYYDYRLLLMAMVLPSSTNPSPFGNAPILCFRDIDDILRIVRYSYTSQTVAAPAAGYQIINDLYCFASDGQVHNEEIVDLAWGTVVTAGFYCDGAFDDRSKSSDYYYRRTHTLDITPDPIPATPGYDGSNYFSTSLVGNPLQGSGAWGLDAGIKTGSWILQNASFVDVLYKEEGSSSIVETLIMVPGYDSRSVYKATFETLPNPSVLYNKLSGYRGWIDRFYIQPDPPVIGATGNLYGGHYGYIYTANGGLESTYGSSSTIYGIDALIVDRTLINVSFDSRRGTDYFTDVGSWASFFEASIYDPYSELLFWIRHSIENDMVYDTNIPPDLSEKYGDYDRFSTFNYIGWA